MGELYLALPPRCDIHGPIHHQVETEQGRYWVCQGFDGEGCGVKIASDDLEWTHIGEFTNEHTELTISIPRYAWEVR